MSHHTFTEVFPHPLYLRLSEICPGELRQIVVDKLVITIQRYRITENPFVIDIVAANSYGSAFFGIYPTGVEGMSLKGNNFLSVPFPTEFQPKGLKPEELQVLATTRAYAVFKFLEFI